MVEIKHGLVPMVFNAGICFLLTGTGLVCYGSDNRKLQNTGIAIGGVLVGLTGLTLLEHLIDRSIGIDLATVHTWYDYGNTRPGRMAPNTALSFTLIGWVFLLWRRVEARAKAIAVILLTFCVLALGLTGLVGYLLAPDLLFGWARSGRMAIHTASGIILSAMGLYVTLSNSRWYASGQFFTEDSKIRLLSAGILLIVTATSGLTGFVLLQGSYEHSLSSRLEALLRDRTVLFRSVTSEVSHHATQIVALTGMDMQAKRLLADPLDKVAAIPFDALARRLIDQGYRGVMLESVRGTRLRMVGDLPSAPSFSTPLATGNASELLWDRGVVVRTRVALVQDGKPVGSVSIDQVVPALDASFANLERIGKTAELALCVGRDSMLLCLPNGKNASVFQVKLPGMQKSRLPMELALAGGSGIVGTLDYRNENVIAAYGELVPGLGLVVKQDAKEAYASIREALISGAPIILIVSVLGSIMLYSQLNPLITRMWNSERRADDSAIEMRTIMEAAGDGIITIDHLGSIQSANVAACSMFGYGKEELIGQNVTRLMPAKNRHAHSEGLARVVAGSPSTMLGTPNIQVEGLKKTGHLFPIELTINAVPLSGKSLFVGLMRDITVRKAIEEKLSRLAQFDTLTGLPNRALFMDRLASAALRARRASATMAVMFVDLDGFKLINDSFGHQGGDSVLVQVAERLSSTVRKTDTVARLAGDEFTVILESLTNTEEDVKMIAQKINKLFQTPFRIAGQDARVTVSIGVVIYDGRDGDIDVNDLLRGADEQMYLTKTNGKNAFNLTRAEPRLPVQDIT